MAANTIPTVSTLPPAPTRADAPADFTAKADTFVASLPGLVTQVNLTVQGMNTQASYLDQLKTDVNGYKNAAAQSVTDAATQVQLAKDQVTAAATQANNSQTYANQSKDYRDSSQVYASAAQAAAGAPAIQNKADQLLSVKSDASGVEYRVGPKRPTSATADQFVKVNSAGNGFDTAVLPFTKEYVGGQTTLQGSSALSYGHGFGVTPKLVTLELICLATASGGYVAGDIIEIGTFGSSAYSGSVNQHSGFVVTKDASIIIVRVSPNIQNMPILTKSGNGYTTIASQVNWAYRVRAFA